MLALVLFISLQPAAIAPCSLSEEELTANSRLTFEEFDQQGTLPSSARKLAERGCWQEAADATRHYLVNGPLANERQQRTMRFHLAQQLANAGRLPEASYAVAGTRNPDENLTDPETLRWNDFVRGHWASFVKDRAALHESIAALKRGSGYGNTLNTNLLEGLAACFDRPYAVAVKEPCRKRPPAPAK